jgi:peptide/nickel transport system permease protein
LARDSRKYIREASWIALFPGLAIAVTVLGLNLLGDGLRDALDPRIEVQQG